jgi:hypothetical protein
MSKVWLGYSYSEGPFAQEQEEWGAAATAREDEKVYA